MAEPSKERANGAGSPTVRQAIRRGVALWEQDDFEAAFRHFEAVLREHPDFADVRNKAGLCLAMMGDVHRALAQFDRALELNDGYAEAHLNRAIVLNELGRFDEAREAFERASELDTRHGDEFPSDVGNKLAIAHARVGDLYLVADHPAEAAEAYQKALAIRPSYADIRSKLAEAYVDLARFDEARAELERILEERPEFTGARVKLGVVLHRTGDDEGARREWELCRETAPDDMRVRAFLASLE